MLKINDKRPYQAVIGNGNGKTQVKIFYARTRRRAVHAAQLWFWYEYHGSLGPVHRAMTVDDPYFEVRYGRTFICSDRLNKLLPEDVVKRLLIEANGELIRDTREGRRNYQPNSVRRIKRRRDFGAFIAPAIRKMRNGVLYYRITTAPQVSKKGVVLAKRKYRDIRLKARSLAAAIDEIKVRELNELHRSSSVRNVKARDLVFTGHVAGLITYSVLSDLQSARYSRILPKYLERRTIPA